MLFNSLIFLLFLPTVIVIFFNLPLKIRSLFLLLASYCFYMYFKPIYIFLILASTLVDFFAAQYIGKSESIRQKRLGLVASLVCNLGLLFVFKYYDFTATNVNILLDPTAWQMPYLDVILPMGISFYTFQTLSYTIDVYYGTVKPEKNLITFALYVAYFPQLVAGPIERATSLLPQLKQEYVFDFKRVGDGLLFILWGLFLKLAIADQVAEHVDKVFGNVTAHSGLKILEATHLFSIQLFCDFAGYSIVAIGCAKVLGVQLMRNFDAPYLSRDFAEVWRRWTQYVRY